MPRNLQRYNNCHTVIVFTRYMMQSLESLESNDERTLGEPFLYFSDEFLMSHGYRIFKCYFKCLGLY